MPVQTLLQMETALLITVLIFCIINIILVLTRKNNKSAEELSALSDTVKALTAEIARQERIIREEFQSARQERRSAESENRM